MEKEVFKQKDSKDETAWIKGFLGENYFEQYKRLLSIVIPCVVFGLALGWLIQMIQEPNIYWYMEIGRWIGGVIGAIVSVSVVTAIVFSFLERNNIKVNIGNIGKTFNSTTQDKKRKINRAGVLTSILAELFFTLIFLLIPQIFVGVFQGGEEVIQIFNVAYIQQTWLMIVMMWGLGFIIQLTKLVYAKYNWVIVAVTALGNSGIAFLAVRWLSNDQLMNEAFMSKMVDLVAKQEALLSYGFIYAQQLLISIICFALAIEIIEVLIKTLVPKKA